MCVTAILDIYLDEDTMYSCLASNAMGIAEKSVFVTGNRLSLMQVNTPYPRTDSNEKSKRTNKKEPIDKQHH
jgi:hypothetical protein